MLNIMKMVTAISSRDPFLRAKTDLLNQDFFQRMKT